MGREQMVGWEKDFPQDSLVYFAICMYYLFEKIKIFSKS